MIVAFAGRAGCGKSTAADYLSSHGYIILSFGNILKDTVAVMFSWDRALLSGNTEESRIWREKPDEWWSRELGHAVSPRNILQTFATETVRNHFHPDFWIIAMKRKIQSLPPDAKIVISDLRFENEYWFLRNLGATIIRINRNDAHTNDMHTNDVYINDIHVDENKHISEMLYHSFDCIDVINNGTRGDLFNSIDKILKI